MRRKSDTIKFGGGYCAKRGLDDNLAFFHVVASVQILPQIHCKDKTFYANRKCLIQNFRINSKIY